VVGHVACMGERRGAYKFLVWENVRERDDVEDVDVDGRKSMGIWTEFKNLSKDRDMWWAVLEEVMKFCSLKTRGIP